MNRVEQLTLDLLDGVLDGPGLDELQRLLAADPTARAIHFGLCEQEAALRGRLSAFDVSRRAMDRVRGAMDRVRGALGQSATRQTDGSAQQFGQVLSSPPVPGEVASPPPPGIPGRDFPTTGVPPGGIPAGFLAGGMFASPPSRGVSSAGFPGPGVSTPSVPASRIPAPPPPWAPASSPAALPELHLAEQDGYKHPWAPMGSPAALPPNFGAGSGPPVPVETAVAPPPGIPAAEPSGDLPLVDEGAALEEPSRLASFYQSISAGLYSMLIHLAGMILLAAWAVPQIREAIVTPLLVSVEPEEMRLEEERPFETVLLDESVLPSTELTFADMTTPLPGGEGLLTSDFSLKNPDTDLLSDDYLGPEPTADWAIDHAAGNGGLLTVLPEKTVGVGRVVVDDYQQALDRITQEILRMLAKRNVLVIWCFDQSESMKDDQQEIRDRIERVYAELEMAGATESDALTTAVTSFGSDFMVHTPIPTAEPAEIRAAIDAVPVDSSGEEMMCRAVARSIFLHRKYAKLHDRQMALILVSDESGNREENDMYLEPTIGQALAARCKVYVLGREAVFGYPVAHVRWVHPETGREHWLPVDRGPETAFPEQLQTEGFEQRTDAHPSGFGPYGQSRLAWRTGGIFFMLPSIESDLVRGEKRRYALEAMQPYQPDLRSCSEIVLDRDRSLLRTLVMKIVYDLDPTRKDVAKWMNVRMSFSSDFEEFQRQVREASMNANHYFTGVQRGIEALEKQRPAREEEPSRRWKANYDLVRAQLESYGARTHLYRSALESALEKLDQTPTTLPGNKRLVAWKVRQSQEVPMDDLAMEMIERSRRLYLHVIKNHPGTPWAARAEWELKRDFGFPGASALADMDPASYEIEDWTEGGDVTNHLASAAAPGVGVGTGVGVGEGVGTGTGVGVGVGGGGGGGAGTGVGVGIGVDESWGLALYPAVEVVPEYRTPPPPRPAGSGGGGPRPSGGGGGPRPSPPPKL